MITITKAFEFLQKIIVSHWMLDLMYKAKDIFGLPKPGTLKYGYDKNSRTMSHALENFRHALSIVQCETIFF